MQHGRPYQLVPIRRVDVYREVLAQVETYIRQNKLKEGDRIPSDRDLSQLLGVSRGSVRQAIKVLESAGRLETQQGSGTYVRAPSHRAGVSDLMRGLPMDDGFIAQLVPVRNAIEVAVLESAFDRRSPRTVAALKAALDERERTLRDNSETGSLDLSFEAALGAICGNELLQRMQALVHEVWLHAWPAVGKAPGDKFLLQDEHRRIFERFRDGDRAGARRLFVGHLDMAPAPPPRRRSK